jgi:probable O-glycosylation ligase (exosortase A-associated)
VIVASLCYFGVKGGLFTIATGGSYRVWGPPDSLIFGNNELAIALVMTVPLLYYLSQQTERVWFKRGLYLAMVLCSAAAIGSQSRGAFLAIIAMVGALSWKSKHKFRITVVLIALIPIFLTFMPDSWWERMNTIRTYEEDTSAMGRIVAWKTAWNIASDRLTGAGFATSTRFIYDLYSPDPSALVLVAHSIYFQVLGAHGFIGLFLYLMLWWTTYRLAGRLKKLTKNREDLIWIRDLGRMIQVSFLGFFVGGAFLSLAYWDVPYYFLVIIVALERLARQPPETVAPPVAAEEAPVPAHVNIPPQLSRRP